MLITRMLITMYTSQREEAVTLAVLHGRFFPGICQLFSHQFVLTSRGAKFTGLVHMMLRLHPGNRGDGVCCGPGYVVKAYQP